jgi:hypothetical protein
VFTTIVSPGTCAFITVLRQQKAIKKNRCFFKIKNLNKFNQMTVRNRNFLKMIYFNIKGSIQLFFEWVLRKNDRKKRPF